VIRGVRRTSHDGSGTVHGQIAQVELLILQKNSQFPDEPVTLFKCTVVGFHCSTFHKWAGGGVPSQAMEIQEMGVDVQDRTEPGGSNDDKIFV